MTPTPRKALPCRAFFVLDIAITSICYAVHFIKGIHLSYE